MTGPILTARLAASGIVVVVLDVPGEPVNTLGPAAVTELDALLEELRADAEVRGVVLISGKPDNFIAGADINTFTAHRDRGRRRSPERRPRTFSWTGWSAFRSRSSPPFTAPVSGSGSSSPWPATTGSPPTIPRPSSAFPRSSLASCPGSGGSNRLPRRIGVRAALDIILAGKSERAAKAYRLGLVDELVPPPILEEVAVRAADRLAREGPPRRSPRAGIAAAFLDRTTLGRAIVYRTARKQVLRRTRGHYPAPLRGHRGGPDRPRAGDAGGARRGSAGLRRAGGDAGVAAAGRGSSSPPRALKKDDGVPAGTGEPRAIRRFGVVGAGFMGSAIAGTAVVTAGVEVRLEDADLARVGRGIRGALALVDARLARKRISRYEHARLTALVSGGVDLESFRRADLVIEAVFEDLDVKRQVLARAGGACSSPERSSPPIPPPSRSPGSRPRPGIRSGCWACTSSPRSSGCRCSR